MLKRYKGILYNFYLVFRKHRNTKISKKKKLLKTYMRRNNYLNSLVYIK